MKKKKCLALSLSLFVGLNFSGCLSFEINDSDKTSSSDIEDTIGESDGDAESDNSNDNNDIDDESDNNSDEDKTTTTTETDNKDATNIYKGFYDGTNIIIGLKLDGLDSCYAATDYELALTEDNLKYKVTTPRGIFEATLESTQLKNHWSGTSTCKLEEGAKIEVTVAITDDAIKIIETEDQFTGETIIYFKSKTYSKETNLSDTLAEGTVELKPI